MHLTNVPIGAMPVPRTHLGQIRLDRQDLCRGASPGAGPAARLKLQIRRVTVGIVNTVPIRGRS
jgi:hypothetical protein